MAILESEDFDGLSEGETISTSNTSFDTVTGSSLDATTDAIHGTGALDISVASSTDTCRWTTNVDGRTLLYHRGYYRVVSVPGNDAWFCGCGNDAGTVALIVIFRSSGELRIMQSDETGNAENSAQVFAADDEFRIEWELDLDNDTQTAELYYGANIEGTTPDETLSTSASMGDMADWRVGRILSRDTPLIADALAIGDDWIGPADGGATDLTVADSAQAQTAESPTLTQTHELTAADAGQAQAAESPALTQVHTLAVDSATHTQTASEPALTQQHQLVTDGAAHDQAADSPTLTGGVSLTVDSAGHTQAAAEPTVTQVHILAPADAGHGQAVDQPTLTQVHVLVVADATHAQAAAVVTLSVGEITTPAERTSVALSEVRTSVATESRVSIVHAESRVSVAR